MFYFNISLYFQSLLTTHSNSNFLQEVAINTFLFSHTSFFCYKTFFENTSIQHGLKLALYPVQPGNCSINQFKLHNFVILKLWKNAVLKPFWDNKVDSWHLLQRSSSNRNSTCVLLKFKKCSNLKACFAETIWYSVLINFFLEWTFECSMKISLLLWHGSC